jgi:hypothetical protein
MMSKKFYIGFLSIFLWSGEAWCGRFFKSKSPKKIQSLSEKWRVSLKRELMGAYSQYNLFLTEGAIGRDDDLPLDSEEIDINEGGFKEFTNGVLSKILAEPASLMKAPIKELASFFKQATLVSGSEDPEGQKIDEYFQDLFGSEFSFHFLRYILHESNENAKYLHEFYVNRDQFKEHLFFECLRRENDIILLSTFISNQMRGSDSDRERALSRSQKFNDFATQSSFRVTLFLALYSESHEDTEGLLQKSLDEEQLTYNQRHGVDFDVNYGRYNMVGQILENYLSFQRNLEKPEWSETKIVFQEILKEVQHNIGSYRGDYLAFLNKMRKPIETIPGKMSAYQVLLMRDNFVESYK